MKAGTCIHFNGTMNEACEIGVNYHDLAGGPPGFGWALRLPCIGRPNPSPLESTCDKLVRTTPEQAAEWERVALEGFRQRMAAINRGECPDCKRPVKMRQVGRCVYGDCGHRLYQGRLPPGK